MNLKRTMDPQDLDNGKEEELKEPSGYIYYSRSPGYTHVLNKTMVPDPDKDWFKMIERDYYRQYEMVGGMYLTIRLAKGG